MDDSDVVAYRWVESTRHPTEDICDEYAKVDMYGLGPGIFPKDKAPELPAHHHCLCHYEKVYRAELVARNKAALRKNILFPFDDVDSVGIPREVSNRLSDAFQSIEDKFEINKPVLLSVEMIPERSNVPLQYQANTVGNLITHRIVINSGFNWEGLNEMEGKVKSAHKKG